MRSKTLVAALVTSFLLFAPRPADADIAAAAFAVKRYRHQCGGSNLKWPDSNASRLLGILNSHGFTTNTFKLDQEVKWENWRDANLPGGKDNVTPYGTDWADVVYFDGHGSYTCSGSRTSYLFMGDKTQSCSISARHDIRFGNGPAGEDDSHDTNIGIAFSCNSAQYCVFRGGGYSPMAHGKFMAWNGFHGLSYDSRDNFNRLGKFARAAKWHGIGDDWIDWMTDLKFWWWENEQCATSLTWGNSSSEARYHFSRGGLRTWHQNIGRNRIYYSFLCSCDPKSGEKLPGC